MQEFIHLFKRWDYAFADEKIYDSDNCSYYSLRKKLQINGIKLEFNEKI